MSGGTKEASMRNLEARRCCICQCLHPGFAAIRTAFEQRGELSAVVELRRLFPGVGNIAWARECVRTIVDWPSPPVRLARRSLKRRDYHNVRSATVPGRTLASPLASPSTEAQALDIASHGLSHALTTRRQATLLLSDRRWGETTNCQI